MNDDFFLILLILLLYPRIIYLCNILCPKYLCNNIIQRYNNAGSHHHRTSYTRWKTTRITRWSDSNLERKVHRYDSEMSITMNNSWVHSIIANSKKPL